MTLQPTDGNAMTNANPKTRRFAMMSIPAAALLLAAGASDAASRHGAVLATGQVVMAAGAGTQACGSNDDLVFTFTETASASSVELARPIPRQRRHRTVGDH